MASPRKLTRDEYLRLAGKALKKVRDDPDDTDEALWLLRCLTMLKLAELDDEDRLKVEACIK